MNNPKIILYDETFRTQKILSGNFIPRVGDNVDCGYLPAPLVKKVVYLPDGNETMKEEFILVVV